MAEFEALPDATSGEGAPCVLVTVSQPISQGHWDTKHGRHGLSFSITVADAFELAAALRAAGGRRRAGRTPFGRTSKEALGNAAYWIGYAIGTTLRVSEPLSWRRNWRYRLLRPLVRLLRPIERWRDL